MFEKTAGRIDRRAILIGFRVTQDERRALEAFAQRSGLTLSDLARAAMAEYLRQQADTNGSGEAQHGR